MVFPRPGELLAEVLNLCSLLLRRKRGQDPLGVALQPLPVPPEPFGVRLDLIALLRHRGVRVGSLLLPRLSLSRGGALLLRERALIALQPVALAPNPGGGVVRGSLSLGRVGHGGLGLGHGPFRVPRLGGRRLFTRISRIRRMRMHPGPDAASRTPLVPVKQRLDQRGSAVAWFGRGERVRGGGRVVRLGSARFNAVVVVGPSEVVILRVIRVRTLANWNGGFLILAKLLVVVERDGRCRSGGPHRSGGPPRRAAEVVLHREAVRLVRRVVVVVGRRCRSGGDFFEATRGGGRARRRDSHRGLLAARRLLRRRHERGRRSSRPGVHGELALQRLELRQLGGFVLLARHRMPVARVPSLGGRGFGLDVDGLRVVERVRGCAGPS